MVLDIGKSVAKGFGFDNGNEYVAAGFFNGQDKFLTYPKMIKRRVFHTKNVEEMKADARDGDHVELKKTLGWFELTCLGVGFMCGAGIFVSPGYIASALTGPALCVAYLVAALSAFLSSFCYAEFSTAIPLAGAAYNYVYSTLGELIAWITVGNLILEYIMANAAAVRGFSPYLALLFDKPSTYFIRNWHGYRLDGWACGVTVFVTAILAYGIKESATANAVITIIHVLVMVFIIIAGLTKANKDNFKPFIKAGSSWKNIFNGAAISFFSFIGFDALATTVEEMKDPVRDMPLGILGSVSIVTVIYVLMCTTLCLMVPTPNISDEAAFAAAFDYVGMKWAKYIVSIGALLGIFTTTLIGVLGAARILVGCCRERMLPPFFATVGSRRQTPWVATWAVGLTSAGIALFSDFAELANMLSIGTLLVFYVVALALLWYRSYIPGKTSRKQMLILLINLFAIMGFSMGFTLVWVLPRYADEIPADDYGEGFVEAGPSNKDQWKWLVAMGVCFIASCISFKLTVKEEVEPVGYRVPLFPFVPAASAFINNFLLGQLDVASYKRFGWWTVAAVAVYAIYGSVAQEAHDIRTDKLSSLPQYSPHDGSMEGKSLEHDVKIAKGLDAETEETVKTS